jgi:hypothetical protein
MEIVALDQREAQCRGHGGAEARLAATGDAHDD